MVCVLSVSWLMMIWLIKHICVWFRHQNKLSGLDWSGTTCQGCLRGRLASTYTLCVGGGILLYSGQTPQMICVCLFKLCTPQLYDDVYVNPVHFCSSITWVIDRTLICVHCCWLWFNVLHITWNICSMLCGTSHMKPSCCTGYDVMWRMFNPPITQWLVYTLIFNHLADDWSCPAISCMTTWSHSASSDTNNHHAKWCWWCVTTVASSLN